MEKIRPEDLKNPDIFVHEVGIVWQWAHKHQKVLSIIFGSLLLVGIGYSLYEYMDNSKEEKSQVALFEAMHNFEKKHESFEAAEAPKKDKAKDAAKKLAKKSSKTDEEGEDQDDEDMDQQAAVDPSNPAQKATGDFEKDYGTVVHDLEKVALENLGSKASVVAAITAADVYRDYNQPDRALKLLNDVARKLPPVDVLRATVLLNIGDFHQVKGECDKAVQEWENIVKEPKYGFLKPDALLREALCYKVSGQNEKSNDLLKKLTSEQDLSSTRAGQAAKKYLRIQGAPEASSQTAKKS